MSGVPTTPQIPDDLIEGVRQRLETAEMYQWELGDYLVEAEDEIIPHLARQVRYPRSYLINQISSRVGCDPSTLRDRASMARFYPPPIRQAYTPLTYHQLRACKSAGIHWQVYAEWALNNLPAPVAAIRAHVKHNGHSPPAWVGRWQRFVELAGALVDDAMTDPLARDIASQVLRRGGKVILPGGGSG